MYFAVGSIIVLSEALRDTMQRIHDKLIFSPSDLITFMDSKFDSWMARFNLEYPGEVQQDAADQSHALLQKLGNRHEETFLAHLKDESKEVAEIPVTYATHEAERETLAAMKAGHEIIYQGVLSLDSFAGRTDFLCRVPGSSLLGDHHYEVWDTKLAKKVKPYFVVQLCCYAEMLHAIQGVLPKSVSIVLGDQSKKTFHTNDFIYFYKQLKQSFLDFQNAFSRTSPPEDMTAGHFSKWKTHSEKLLAERDSLTRIANIRRVQIQRLQAVGIDTLKGLAECNLNGVPKMSLATFSILKGQARLQRATESTGKTVYEFLPPLPGKGFSLLPPGSELDVYFDMEGYPHAEGGLEYLFGASFTENGAPQFKDWWAHDRDQEKQAFESFIDWVIQRWHVDRQMHVYHYASYEVSAIRRLAGRHNTRIEEVDNLLRHEVFIDLHQIVRQGLQVGEPSYSIKYIEHLYRGKRAGDVAKASDSVVFYERWIEEPDGSAWTDSEILRSIRDYNEEDCVSTMQLTSWLRSINQGVQSYKAPTLPAGVASEESPPGAASLAAQLWSESDSIPDSETQRVQRLLASLLEFHEREQKPIWWRYFDRRKMSDEELQDDLDCLAGLKRTRTAPLTPKGGRSPAFEYSFDPDQDTKLEQGDGCLLLHDAKTRVTIVKLDRASGLVQLKFSPRPEAPPAELSIVRNELIDTRTIADSIHRIVSQWQQSKSLKPALRDLLFRQEPNLRGRQPGQPVVQSSQVEHVVSAIERLEGTTLSVQGPPGCGKTYTATQTIVSLLKKGYRVGITSNSHKAIEHLLERVGEEATKQSIKLKGMKIGGENPDDGTSYRKYPVAHAKTSSAFFGKKEKIRDYNLVAGTAWVFSNLQAAELLDYLFVDEAGQVCLANVVGMSSSTRNLILVGDQMQLEQPIQGSHPGESGQSCLEYLLQDKATVPPNFGIFLDTTYRMHPDLCTVISSAIYDSRLHHDGENERQKLVIPQHLTSRLTKTTGIDWIPVFHTGNAQASVEEADAIAALVKDLLNCTVIDKRGNERPVTLKDDILIVAPYNMQVRLISDRIKGVQVASVDKFQGREAPIVILSMCASEGSSSPRGVDFLFNKSRLNVAISRAQCLAFVVGSEELIKTNCSTLPQMDLLNLFCRLVTVGKSAPEIRHQQSNASKPVLTAIG
jgi:predicted RecB family nuclease